MKNKNPLLPAGILTALTILLIILVKTVDVAPVGPEGTSVGFSQLNLAVAEQFGVSMTWYKITTVLGVFALALAGFFALVGLIQLILRKSLMKVDKELLALGGLYAATLVLYVLFEKVIVNYRPMIMPGETAPEASFPSTHTMLFFTILGSAAMVAGRYLKDERKALLVKVACGVLLILGVAFRLGSGVHWFTDICGGVLISSALLLAFSAYLEKIDGK